MISGSVMIFSHGRTIPSWRFGLPMTPFLSGLCILLLSRSGDDSGTPVTNSDSPQEASFVADFGAGSVDLGACLSMSEWPQSKWCHFAPSSSFIPRVNCGAQVPKLKDVRFSRRFFSISQDVSEICQNMATPNQGFSH